MTWAWITATPGERVLLCDAVMMGSVRELPDRPGDPVGGACEWWATSTAGGYAGGYARVESMDAGRRVVEATLRDRGILPEGVAPDGWE
jgi:hypothetical protein